MVSQLLIFIILSISVILMIFGIFNLSTTWGKWMTVIATVVVLVSIGVLLYSYFKKNQQLVDTLKSSLIQEIYPNDNVIVTNMYSPVYDSRERSLFLMNDMNITDENIIKYLQSNMVNISFLFTAEYTKIVETISAYDITTKQMMILYDDPSRLFKFQKVLGKAGKVGTPYIFRVRGQDIIIKVSKNIDVFSRAYTDLNRYQCFNVYSAVKNETCFPSKESIKAVVGSSEYVNETVIGFLLNQIFFISYYNGPEWYSIDGKLNEMFDLGNSVFQIGFFQNKAEKIGYNVMEKCDNTLDKLVANINDPSSDFNKIVFVYNGNTYTGNSTPDKIMLMILQQVNSLLMILKTMFSFNHGDLKGGNLFYRIEEDYLGVDYPLDGLSFFKDNEQKAVCRTNLRIKIADYGKASMTFNYTHYYCNETKYNANKLIQRVTDPEQMSVSSYSPLEGGKYLFDSTTPVVGLDISLRHLACPYFLSADYYILLTSLSLSSPYFYDFIVRNGIYALLGVSFDTKSKRPESVVSAVDKVKGQYLKCGIMQEVSDRCLLLL